MLGWLFGRNIKKVEEKTEIGFNSVRRDIDHVGKWIKHLDSKDKQLFDSIFELKEELSSIKSDFEGLREAFEISQTVGNFEKSKQVFKKLPVVGQQTAVGGVEDGVQTGVQTANIHGILKGLSRNEKLLVMTLMGSDMKLSYEDLAMLLGKERSTIRGQINAIKQKSEGLLEEFIEKNGKKRVFVPGEIKEKLAKYAKVRVGKGRKSEKVEENDDLEEEK
jgi:hypothetical protein